MNPAIRRPIARNHQRALVPPPLAIHAAEGEVLRSDATRLAERVRAAGVEVRLHLYPDTVHVFPLFSFLPETVTAMQRIGDFVTERGDIDPNEVAPESSRVSA